MAKIAWVVVPGMRHQVTQRSAAIAKTIGARKKK